MLRPMMGVALAAMLLAACGQKNTDHDKVEGPAVSTAVAPTNVAVDTKPTTDESGPTPGASSYTADQARMAIEKAGYANLGPLSQNANGLWQGEAVKDGQKVNVSIDYKGAITAL